MLLYLIRHGETPWNTEGRMQGHADTPLNEMGILLAKITGEKLEHVHFDLAISSPLKRAAETARLIMGKRKAPVLFDDRIREINWGKWEGLCALKHKNEIPDNDFRKFYTDPFGFDGAPEGESILDVCHRTKEFYKELVQNPDYQDKTILVATHGCAVRGILNNVYSDKDNFWQGGVPANCAVNIVKVANGESTLVERDIVYYDEVYKTDYYR